MGDLLGSPRVAPLFPSFFFFYFSYLFPLHLSKRHFSGYRSILHGSNFIYKNITRNRVPTSNLRALEGKDPLTRVDAHTNELFERGVHRCVRVSGNCTGPVGTPRGSVPGMDGLLISKCCADFINILSFFCCEFTLLLQTADSFGNGTIPGG